MSNIPVHYRAAGVVLTVGNKLLLCTEVREDGVCLHFLAGRREVYDRDAFATASREFHEECAYLNEAKVLMESIQSRCKPKWFPSGKMVLFIAQVSMDEVKPLLDAFEVRQTEKRAAECKTLGLHLLDIKTIYSEKVARPSSLVRRIRSFVSAHMRGR